MTTNILHTQRGAVPPTYTDRQQRIHDFLSRNTIGVLSTVDSEGNPHGVTIYYATSPTFDVAFLTRVGTQKHRDIKHDNRVMLTVFEPATQTTLQATMATDGGKMPDIGLIAQGYTLQWLGEGNELGIGSWVSHDKRSFAKQTNVKFEADKWYTLKLKVSNQNGKAVCQAKIWEKSSTEPASWTIELTDPSPNTHGAPGLFGNATNAEVTIDNVTVEANNAQ